MFWKIIDEISGQLEISIEPGISIEIKDFYEGNKDVNNFNVEIIEEKKYKITVELKKYSLQVVKKIFSSFLNFIQYSDMSFYLRIDKVEEIQYTLITGKENKKGIYCEIIFVKEI